MTVPMTLLPSFQPHPRPASGLPYGPAIFLCLVVLAMLNIPATAADPDADAGRNRLQVLMIGEGVDVWPQSGDLAGRSLAERSMLEAMTTIRFTAAPMPHPGGSGALDLNAVLGRADESMIPVRRQAVLELLLQPWDAVIVAPGRTRENFDAEIQQALVDHVARGGVLVWLGGTLEVPERGRGYPEALEALQAILPYQDGPPLSTWEGPNPLAGLALGLDGLRIQPAKLRGAERGPGNGFATLFELEFTNARYVDGQRIEQRESTPMIVYRRFERGAVLGLGTGDRLFPDYQQTEIDGERVWAEALERLLRFARGEQIVPLQVTAQLVSGSQVSVELIAPAQATVDIMQSDMRGGRQMLRRGVAVAAGQALTLDLASSLYRWQEITVLPLGDGLAPTSVYIERKSPVTLSLDTEKHATADAPEAAATLTLQAAVDTPGLHLCWTLRDWAGRPVHYAEEPLPVLGRSPLTRPFTGQLSDTDPRAWVYWLQAVVMDADRTPIAQAELALYRYGRYDMSDQILLSTWHTEGAGEYRPLRAPFLRYLRAMGYDAVHGYKHLPSLERHNMRVYEEFGGSTTYGQDRRTAPFNEAIEGYAERYRQEGVRRARSRYYTQDPDGERWPSPALNLFSMGEETGFGRWSEAYPWRNEERAPDECNKWFRHFLQQKYGSLDALNQQWGSAYSTWDQLAVWRKYAEPFGWLYRAPPADLEENLSPYVDTHAFHEWYVSTYIQHFWEGFASENPVATWTMSFDFTFLQRSPAPLTFISYALPPENPAAWHAYNRPRTPGGGAPFSMNWSFFPHEGFNNQFLKLSYALGCTYISTWGHQFNTDLTPTFPMVNAARVRHELRPAEAVIRKMQPHDDPRIGIFTFDSPWNLVRGRYGFVMHRQGPNDLGMGVGPHLYPGASQVTPPELPLYSALTASGYSPRYVTPAEFGDCELLFMPYVEALSQEIADQLRAYVEAGGTLIAFPVIAQYDAGGKPFGTYPGAGLDQLFGFTAERDWVLGRQPVTFPSQTQADAAFQAAFELTSGVATDKTTDTAATAAAAPVYVDFTLRIGGHPNHYLSEGHERIRDLAPDTVVVAEHEDGQPLLTYRRVGKGSALCFNTLICNGAGLDNAMVPQQRETFRQIIASLVRRFVDEPDFHFENSVGYGEGINEFATMQYRLPETDVRILALFEDWRHPAADTRLVLSDGFTQVYDLIAGKALPIATGVRTGNREAAVYVQPGDWRMLAISPDAVVTPELSAPAAGMLGHPFELTASAVTGQASYGRIEIRCPEAPTTDLGHHARSIVLRPREPLIIRPRLDDPAGTWIIRFTNALGGGISETTIDLQAGPEAQQYAGGVHFTSPTWDSEAAFTRGPEISDSEFRALLARLSRIHLSAEPVDKRRYSAYHNEVDAGRQRTNQLLSCVDWPRRLDVIGDSVRRGAYLYLVGEDLGFEPRYGLSMTPARQPNILQALDQLAEQDDATHHRIPGRPYLRVIRIGQGMVIVDRRSPEDGGHTNLHLATAQQNWLHEMQALGLTPDSPAAAQPPWPRVTDESISDWVASHFAARGRPSPTPTWMAGDRMLSP